MAVPDEKPVPLLAAISLPKVVETALPLGE
jgi:hypothetical protein